MATSLGACVGAVDAGNEGQSGGNPGAGAGGASSATGGTGGTSGSAGVGGLGAPILGFVPDGPLTLPRQTQHALEVTAWPPGTVRFALLPGPGETQPGDASLSVTDAETDAEGHVTVLLTAPSTPTTFYVRASHENGLIASREVTVDETGRADLRVQRFYGGIRWEGRAASWFATAIPNETCTSIPGGPFSDRHDWTEGPPGDDDIVYLRGLRAETKLAVVVRIEEFAWGCATVQAVVEGVDNHVQVAVTNVPIQLASSEVTVSLDLSMFQAAFQTAAEPAIERSLASLGESGDDVSALLDRMQAESGADETAFVSARAAGGWDAAVRAVLGPGAATVLREPLGRWIRAGLANTSAGRFVGTLAADQDVTDGAVLTLETVAGLPPAALGLSATNAATWYSSSPEDDVFFGTTLSLDPSALLLGGAVAPATTEIDGAETIAEALAGVLSCDAVATELVAHGTAASLTYPGCAESCARALCESALGTLVLEREEREEGADSRLEIAASAAASVGAQAELEGFEGTWVGALILEDESTSIGGVTLSPAP